MKNRISINGRNGTFGAHVARPEALPAPAVVVLHEGFRGERRHPQDMRRIGRTRLHCRRTRPILASGAGVDLSVTSESDWQHGVRVYQAYDRDAGAMDAKDTANVVSKLPDCSAEQNRKHFQSRSHNWSLARYPGN